MLEELNFSEKFKFVAGTKGGFCEKFKMASSQSQRSKQRLLCCRLQLWHLMKISRTKVFFCHIVGKCVNLKISLFVTTHLPNHGSCCQPIIHFHMVLCGGKFWWVFDYVEGVKCFLSQIFFLTAPLNNLVLAVLQWIIKLGIRFLEPLTIMSKSVF